MGAKGSLLLLLAGSIILGILRSQPSALPLARESGLVRLDFWNGFTGPDGRTLLGMIREFNEQNPDIEVTMQRMEWGIYYNKLMVAGIDERGPEAFVIHASSLPRMQRAGFVGNVEELFTGPNALPLDDYEPALLENIRFDGKLAGLPMDIHPQGLYANAKMLRDAGIVDAEGQARPPATREEFLQAAEKMKIVGEDGVEQWGFALTMWRNNFMALVPQFGGRYFDDQGQPELDAPGNVAALEFMVSLLRKRHLVPKPESNLGWIGFRQHKVAMVFDGVYMLGDLQRLDNFDYIGAPLPQIGSQPGTHGDSHVLCLRADLGDREKAAGLKFIRFLADHGLEWAAAGQIPARRSTRETPEFQQMQVQFAFAKQIPYVKYPPRSPGVFELEQQIEFAVEKALRGRATAAEALNEANENFLRFMNNAGLPMLMEDSQ